MLTPVAIAFWVACDGHYKSSQGIIVISTDSITSIGGDGFTVNFIREISY